MLLLVPGLLLLLFLAPGAWVSAAPDGASDWTMYHRDRARTGYVANLPDPKQLSSAWKTGLDGAVYAEPLVVGGHVLVATEGDTVYSLGASSGAIEWQTNVGRPVSRSSLPCGNIDPLGITGTPVYDAQTGLLFAVAEVQGPAHLLVGIDINTGQVKVNRPIDPPGADPSVHQQRAALALGNGDVYVAYGGLFGDCGNYNGWVVSSQTDGQGALISYKVPTAREGGIWAPPGPAIDADGNLFVSVGNGAETAGAWDHSDSVLKLSPTLNLLDAFAPKNWAQENAADADLGSLGPVLLPSKLVFIDGKAGDGYLLRAGRLGGVGGQIAAKGVCHAYGGAAVVGLKVFLPCREGLQLVRLGPGGTIRTGWQASSTQGSPVVGGRTVYSAWGGKLYALNIANGKQRASADIPATSRFATPTLYGSRIFVGTLSGVVAVDAVR